MKEKTYTFTVFLIKDYVKIFENCIKKEAPVEFIELKKELDLDGKVVVSDSSVNKPKWTEIIDYFSDKEIEIDFNVSNKALLLLRINGRIFALTFGYGRSFLIDENIEKDFGLKTALNLIDTNKIKSINSATIEDLVVYTQKQSGFATEQSNFDINTINDIMTSVTGTTKNDSLATRISGKDSLLVTIKMSISELKEKLCYFLDAYNSDYYKKNGFDWIDNIEYSTLGVPPIRNRIPLVRSSVPPCF
ncbi:MAG: TIGR04141 family sporadically distributed protein [Lachnospiraceae bacterium]|nr:TIGR04141 family sporadically distributed protein [Lachnospiraceae bacterium]